MKDVDLESVVQGYLGAASWLCSTESGEDLNCHNGDESNGFTKEAVKVATRECAAFLAASIADGIKMPDACDQSDQHIGHDLWLARNGHGAGFWDGDYTFMIPGGRDLGAALTKIAERMGERHCFRNDRSKFLHFM